jgi:hypothetical protein
MRASACALTTAMRGSESSSSWSVFCSQRVISGVDADVSAWPRMSLHTPTQASQM